MIDLEEKLYAEMDIAFKLGRLRDGGMAIDDTQLGLEFAMKFYKPHIDRLQAADLKIEYFEKWQSLVTKQLQSQLKIVEENTLLKSKLDELEKQDVYATAEWCTCSSCGNEVGYSLNYPPDYIGALNLYAKPIPAQQSGWYSFENLSNSEILALARPEWQKYIEEFNDQFCEGFRKCAKIVSCASEEKDKKTIKEFTHRFKNSMMDSEEDV